MVEIGETHLLTAYAVRVRKDAGFMAGGNANQLWANYYAASKGVHQSEQAHTDCLVCR